MNHTSHMHATESVHSMKFCLLVLLLASLLGCESTKPNGPPTDASGSTQGQAAAAALCRRTQSVAACGKACDLESQGGASCIKAYKLSAKSLRHRQTLFRRRIGKNSPMNTELEHFHRQVTKHMTHVAQYGARACSSPQAKLCFEAASLLQSLLASFVRDPSISAGAPRQANKAEVLKPNPQWLEARDNLMLRSCQAKHAPACLAAARHWLGRDPDKAKTLLAGSKDPLARNWLRRSLAASKRCAQGQATGCIENTAIVFAADRARFPFALTKTYNAMALGPPISKALLATIIKVRGLGMLPQVGTQKQGSWAREDQRPDLSNKPVEVKQTSPKLVFEGARVSGKELSDALAKRVKEVGQQLQGCIAARSETSKEKAAAQSKNIRLGFWVDGHGSPFNLSNNQRRNPFLRCLFASVATKRLAARGPSSVVLSLKVTTP